MAVLTARALGVQLGSWRDGSTGPAYRALADRIRLLVLDGRVPLGTRLPAERELAAALALSRTTVTSAYAELRESGYVDSVRGSGSVVRLPAAGTAVLPDYAPELLDFSKATLPSHPSVAAAAERATAQLPAYLGESGFDAVGLHRLRDAVAERYTRRGLPTDAGEVMITIGAQHAIGLLARTLLARGDRAVVESPSYPHAFDALRSAGARLVPVTVTPEEGWDDSVLEQAFQRTSPVVAYLMPDFHNPTGRSMPEAQRRRLLDLAARQGTVLVVDETMADMGLDGQPALPPLTGGGATVVLLGSVGKSIWGGLRIGWIRAPRELLQRVARVRFANDLGTPVLEQLIVAELMPALDGILAERRTTLRTGRDHLARELRRRMPSWSMPHVGGGLTAWVNLGAPLSSSLALAARAEGLVIASGGRFGLDGVFERYLRIPFSYPPADLDRGIDALERAWASVTRAPLPLATEDFAQIA